MYGNGVKSVIRRETVSDVVHIPPKSDFRAVKDHFHIEHLPENKFKVVSPLKESPFSVPFNQLAWYGAWSLEIKGEVKRQIFKIYQFYMLSLSIFLMGLFVSDFYQSFGDIKKMSWNICVSTLFYGAVSKAYLLYRKKDHINTLRQKLHEDGESRNAPEDLPLHQNTLKYLKTIKKHITAIAICFGSVWIISRYLTKYSETKLLPIPLAIPLDIDLDDSLTFDVVFVILSVVGSTGIYFIIQQEYGMFSILLQLMREWNVLVNDIPKLDNFSNDSAVIERQVQKTRAKALLRQFCARQQILIRYTEIYEDCYNTSMLLQVLVITVLAVSIAFQCFVLTMDYLPELSYQIGYLTIVIYDMFLLCYIATQLKSTCRSLGQVLYDRNWYRMDSEIRKDIVLMILMSQRPPRVTVTKAVDLNLHAFNVIMKNIYSWLALFRQITMKT